MLVLVTVGNLLYSLLPNRVLYVVLLLPLVAIWVYCRQQEEGERPRPAGRDCFVSLFTVEMLLALLVLWRSCAPLLRPDGVGDHVILRYLAAGGYPELPLFILAVAGAGQISLGLGLARERRLFDPGLWLGGLLLLTAGLAMPALMCAQALLLEQNAPPAVAAVWEQARGEVAAQGDRLLLALIAAAMLYYLLLFLSKRTQGRRLWPCVISFVSTAAALLLLRQTANITASFSTNVIALISLDRLLYAILVQWSGCMLACWRK